jgi:hypothetical protein
MKPAIARAVGVGFVVVLLGLLAWNIHMIPRNQKHLFKVDRFGVHPRSVSLLADRQKWAFVRQRFPTYHRLRLLAGKTVVIDERRLSHRFFLERLSRLRIEVSPVRLELPADAEQRLAAQVDRWWYLGIDMPFQVVLDDAATRYVLAERVGGGLLFLVPESLYLAMQEPHAAGAATAPASPGATP